MADYRDEMFEELSKIIEKTGSDDTNYDDKQKALDILEVLEALLAYTIYSTSIDEKTILTSCDESYSNIKEQALSILENNPIDLDQNKTTD